MVKKKKAAPKKAAPKKAAVKKAPPKKAAPVPVTRAAFAAADEGTTATVHAKFDNANAGVSDFTATHNNQNPKKLSETGDVSFDGVKHGDTIEVSSDSPGDSTVTVSGVNTNPTRMTAKPGVHISDFFLVL